MKQEVNKNNTNSNKNDNNKCLGLYLNDNSKPFVYP